MLGIIQRGIRELDNYLSQPWYRVDKRRALAYLGECAQWVERLEPLADGAAQQPPPVPPRG